jgi:hypothetical protein
MLVNKYIRYIMATQTHANEMWLRVYGDGKIPLDASSAPYVATPGLKAYLILAAKWCGHLQMVFDE